MALAARLRARQGLQPLLGGRRGVPHTAADQRVAIFAAAAVAAASVAPAVY